MNSSRRQFLETGATLCAAAAIFRPAMAAAQGYQPFGGEKTAWHEGFDRYDFLMDDATGAITPVTASPQEVAGFGVDETVRDGKRRGVVIVPRKAAAGLPWSWRGCYWNHQPQSEVELLRRGFHIAFIAPDPGRQGKAWDLWYDFLTRTHGLGARPVFVGMSKGGVNAFNWGGANPDKVACLYNDNPAVYDEDWPKISVLARHGIPLLHVVGTEDHVLQRNTFMVEQIYHQLGGSITILMKEGVTHHPHSLVDPAPIADWIERHMQPKETNRPAIADATYVRAFYYGPQNDYIYLKAEDTYATVRGPGYVPAYDRYDGPGTGNFHSEATSIVVPNTIAPGKPWVFHPSFLQRDSTVAQALLARGYHLVLPPITQFGANQKQWDDVYDRMVADGFARKVVMEGTGAKAGEAYAWAIANPGKVAAIYARNPVMRSLMLPKPLIDNLAPLAAAGVPVLHDCGSRDPWLESQTRAVEKRYKALGGKITVLVAKDEGHFPLSTANPEPVLQFLAAHRA